MCRLIIASDDRLSTDAILRVAPNPPHWSRAIAGNISFLIDTGADVTCLSALDAERFQIYTDNLEEAGPIAGLNGSVMSYKLPEVQISFIDEIANGFIKYHIEEIDYIRVAELPGESDEPPKIFGLLGLDIMRFFDLSTDRENNIAYLKRIRLQEGKYRYARLPMPRTTP